MEIVEKLQEEKEKLMEEIMKLNGQVDDEIREKNLIEKKLNSLNDEHHRCECSAQNYLTKMNEYVIKIGIITKLFGSIGTHINKNNLTQQIGPLEAYIAPEEIETLTINCDDVELISISSDLYISIMQKIIGLITTARDFQLKYIEQMKKVEQNINNTNSELQAKETLIANLIERINELWASVHELDSKLDNKNVEEQSSTHYVKNIINS